MNIKDFPKPHIPKKFPIEGLSVRLCADHDFLSSMLEAEQSLSEFIGYLNNLPNPHILISSLTLQEAVLSSKIEGTIATIADVVQDNTSSELIKNDIREIENYCKAIKYGKEEIIEKGNGISKYLIKNLHCLLLSNNVRGTNKNPGCFKTEQNYIYNPKLGNFTPLPPYLTDEFIDNIIDYLKNTKEVSLLMQAAMMHIQFEMIHPFQDGNGRIGRLLIPLFLYDKKRLPHPIFYISRYFADNEDLYKEKLSNISLNNDDNNIMPWKEWLLFFFKGIDDESKRHISTAKAIINLYKEMSAVIGKTEYLPIIDYLFENLKAEPKLLCQEINLPDNSIRRVLKKLSEGENKYILRQGSDRKTIYYFSKLVELIENNPQKR